MSRFFSRNITGTGRLVRGILALILYTSAWRVYGTNKLLAFFLLATAVFTSVEALAGWCVARACGIKTKF